MIAEDWSWHQCCADCQAIMTWDDDAPETEEEAAECRCLECECDHLEQERDDAAKLARVERARADRYEAQVAQRGDAIHAAITALQGPYAGTAEREIAALEILRRAVGLP